MILIANLKVAKVNQIKIQILQVFHERSVHELKAFGTGKKFMIHINSPKFLLVVIGKLFTLYMVGVRKIGEDLPKHMSDQITIHYFIERIPSSEKKANPYKRCIVCYKKMGKHHASFRTVKLEFM